MILISMSEGMTMMKLEMTEEKTMIFIDSLECILEFNRLNFFADACACVRQKRGGNKKDSITLQVQSKNFKVFYD